MRMQLKVQILLRPLFLVLGKYTRQSAQVITSWEMENESPLRPRVSANAELLSREYLELFAQPDSEHP